MSLTLFSRLGLDLFAVTCDGNAGNTEHKNVVNVCMERYLERY